MRVVERCCVALGGRAWYRRRHLSPPGLQVRFERILRADLPPALSGVRVVQLSDLHAGPFMARGDLARVVALTNELNPDVIVITGDFLTHHFDDVEPILDDLASLRARWGVFAVFGNHDYRDRRDAELASTLARRGIDVLRNSARRFEVEGGALALVGVEDLEESKVLDVEAARATVQPDDFELVLCHHPAGAPFFARARCLAVLAGHTHGLQIDLPFARGAGPAHPGARVFFGATRLVVSRGLGSIGLPLRIGAPTELVVLELERAPA